MERNATMWTMKRGIACPKKCIEGTGPTLSESLVTPSQSQCFLPLSHGHLLGILTEAVPAVCS